MKKYMIVAIASVLSMTQVQAGQMFKFINEFDRPVTLYIEQVNNRMAVKNLVHGKDVFPGKDNTYSLNVEEKAGRKCSLVVTMSFSRPKVYGDSYHRFYLSGESGGNDMLIIFNAMGEIKAQNSIYLGNYNGATPLSIEIKPGDSLEQMKIK